MAVDGTLDVFGIGGDTGRVGMDGPQGVASVVVAGNDVERHRRRSPDRALQGRAWRIMLELVGSKGTAVVHEVGVPLAGGGLTCYFAAWPGYFSTNAFSMT